MNLPKAIHRSVLRRLAPPWRKLSPPLARAGTLLSIVFLLAPTLAADPVSIFFDPEYSVLERCDDIVTIDIWVDHNATDLRGFSLVLEFDPDVIRPMFVIAGSLPLYTPCDHFLHWFDTPADADSLVVDGATLGCSMTGPGPIVRMVFQGHGPGLTGLTALTCRHGRLRDGANQVIPFTCSQAIIENQCPVTTERLPWGRVKAIYR